MPLQVQEVELGRADSSHRCKDELREEIAFLQFALLKAVRFTLDIFSGKAFRLRY